MAGPYHTPGVYVEEISKFPPSVAQVETAIPAFIGYTEKVIANGISMTPDPTELSTIVPVRITSMVDYEESFGGPFNEAFTIAVVDDNVGKTDAEGNALPSNFVIDTGPVEPILDFRMYYSLQMYFSNGGGPCYIISVGAYGNTAPAVSADDLKVGLQALEKEDEPTIILFPDAIAIGTDAAATAEAAAAAAKAEASAAAAAEAEALANDDSSDDAAATAAKDAAATAASDAAEAAALARTAALGSTGSASTFYSIFQDAISQCATLKDRVALCDLYLEDVDTFRGAIGTNNLQYAAAYHPYLKTILTYAYDESAVEITGLAAPTKLKDNANEDGSLFHANNGLYHEVKAAIAKFKIILPPSSIIAGVYASVDSTRGVFKAPANVSISGVIEPTIQIDDADQEALNVDATGGKSINAIRKFTGKGILVWGARTLAGNDNEWRYISVRRFFNMVEESVKKASGQFVFEPNDKNTWVKVRAMIENFLFLQWRAGALAGPKPEQAFYVRVGLGETMSAQDILEGRMIVEIGMAAVRPAEFIILQFSHKMQEA